MQNMGVHKMKNLKEHLKKQPKEKNGIVFYPAILNGKATWVSIPDSEREVENEIYQAN